MKHPDDIATMRETVSKFRKRAIHAFKKRLGSRIHDFDFKPGALVLVRNSRIEESLNRKTKPRYIGPMVVVRKTIGTSYVVAELDGAESQLRVAGFRLVPYFPRTATSVPIVTGVSDNDDPTEDDPEDIDFLASLPPASRHYKSIRAPQSLDFGS